MKAEWATMKSENKLGSEYESYVRTYLTSHGYSIKRTYDIGYVSDPQTWDALATSNSEDSEAIINTYDSLLEYDSLNNLRPALAQSYDVSEDGLTYTFHLREGLTWVDSQGRKVADLKAEDFVAGFQHMLDAEGGLEFLVQGVVKMRQNIAMEQLLLKKSASKQPMITLWFTLLPGQNPTSLPCSVTTSLPR